MNTNWVRILGYVAGLTLPSCSDESAVIGHFHSMRDTAPANPSDAGAGALGPDAAPSGSAEPGPGDRLALEPATRAQFCAGKGSALRVVGAATSTSPACTPGIGRQLFRYGLCSCGDLSATQNLSAFTLDAFDSRNGPLGMGESGAALGIDGVMRVGNVAVGVSGNTIIAGGGELVLSNTLSFLIGADFKTNASIESAGGGVFTVQRDLWIDGDILPGLTTNITRDVYQTAGHSGADSIAGVGGARQTRRFMIEAPCACGQGRELDIAALVADAQRVNDNGELGVSAAGLRDMLQQGTVPAALACGRFSVAGSSLPEGVLRALTGRLALFVSGDLTLQGDFASDLAPEAELDVFVSGDLIIPSAVQIGMPARPSAVRLYISGSAPLELNDRVKLAAQIYAPHVPVKATNPGLYRIEAYGSMLAASFDLPAFFTQHYDRAVAELGEHCQGAPPPRCDSCEQCPSGLACIDGACAVCRTDADCCEPFGCMEGKCQPLIYTPPMK